MKAIALLTVPIAQFIVSLKASYRSLLSLTLAAIAVFLVSCGNTPTVAKAFSYTPAQLEQIQRYATDVEELRDLMLEIPPLVQQKQWNDVQTFVHGPLGEIRTKISNLTRSLQPEVQADARTAAQEFFEHLVLIDEAAKEQNNRKALTNYNGALQDFDAFLKFVPAAARPLAVENG